MKERCHNPNSKSYPYYGGRGIAICEEWQFNFEAFQKWALSSGYQEHLTIERIDNDDNYSPHNCRWATMQEQNQNTRQVVVLPCDDLLITANEAATILGVPKAAILRWRTQFGLTTFAQIEEYAKTKYKPNPKRRRCG